MSSEEDIPFYQSLWNMGPFRIIRSYSKPVLMAFINHWYLPIALSAMGTTVVVYRALDKKGYIKAIFNTIIDSFAMIHKYAEKCTPLIDDISAFFDCFASAIN